MREVWVPVLLSALLGPGLGQLYNREYKKGGLLIGVSLIAVLVMMVSVGRSIMAALPTGNVDIMDPTAISNLAEQINQMFSPSQSVGMAFGYVILTALWIYGIVDAYRGARRLNNAQANGRN